MNNRLHFVGLWCVFLAFSCGGARHSGLNDSATVREPLPLFVVSGGNASCVYGLNPFDAHIFEQFRKIENELGMKLPVVESCFETTGSQLLFASPGSVGAVFSSDQSAFFDFVNSEIDRLKTNRVFLIGFSYGGWLAMQTVRRVPADVLIVHLETIDPISPVTCKIVDYVNGVLGEFGRGTENSGCTTAPPDLEPYYAFIEDRTDSWRNSFQADSTYLHSSVIPQAEANYKYNYKVDPLFTFPAHAYIERDDALWHTVELDVANVIR